LGQRNGDRQDLPERRRADHTRPGFRRVRILAPYVPGRYAEKPPPGRRQRRPVRPPFLSHELGSLDDRRTAPQPQSSLIDRVLSQRASWRGMRGRPAPMSAGAPLEGRSAVSRSRATARRSREEFAASIHSVVIDAGSRRRPRDGGTT
jgi:hypothetical protein